jgi:succinyl-CoA synthetase beta subunit
MARNKITEYRAKRILCEELGVKNTAIAVKTSHGNDKDRENLSARSAEGDTLSGLDRLEKSGKYVVKVDQGVKKRGKLGLLKLGVNVNEIGEFVRQVASEYGYQNFIVEPVIDHSPDQEQYLALQRIREGVLISYSKHGGVEIEENKDKLRTILVAHEDDQSKSSDWSEQISEVAQYLSIDAQFLMTVLETFDQYHFSFLEINPLVVKEGQVFVLDLAVEVDDVAQYFVEGAWGYDDIVVDVNASNEIPQVKAIRSLDQRSQASLKVEMLNPQGKIWLLLSGGGASIVLADEAHNIGFGKEIANYGEYSGNPNLEETYIYTKNIMQMMLEAEAAPKVLIVAGGVANFTDVRTTFKGVIKALAEVAEDLREHQVKVFVRRGGPHADEGLNIMKNFLQTENLLGEVHGPELPLTDIVSMALNYLNAKNHD